MKIVATADLHGHLPTIPRCDVLVIAGDVVPLSNEGGPQCFDWLERVFESWLQAVPADHIVGIAGNHDFAFEQDPALAPLWSWDYLLDSGTEIDGVSFWGTPWTPHLGSWAFYGSPEKQVEAFAAVPERTNVTISHSPPAGRGDGGHPEWTDPRGVNTMLKRVKPQIHICGHIHEGYGRYPCYHKHTDIYNVAYNDALYFPVNKPMIIHL